MTVSRVREEGREKVVRIVATGAANTASVVVALKRLSARPVLTEDPRDVAMAQHLVLPGVGAFGAAMRRLEELGLVQPLRRRLDDNRSTLAICLGMQLLFEGSEESPGATGLGALPGCVERLRITAGPARVPHMGWNTVDPCSTCRLLRKGAGYFANSYCLLAAPAGVAAARTEHGGTAFVSALEWGNLLACQFHPELSGPWGARLIQGWLQCTGAAASGPEEISC